MRTHAMGEMTVKEIREYLKTNEGKGDNAGYRLGLCRCHGVAKSIKLGCYVARTCQKSVEDTGNYADHSAGDDVVYRHRNAVTANAALPLEVVECVCKECHKYVCAGQTANVLDKLTDKHYNHICGHDPANKAT